MGEKRGIVVANLLQEGDVLGVVAKTAHELQRHLESGDEQVRTVERRPPRIQVERGDRGAPGPPGDVGRVGVIQVGEQARVVRGIRAGKRHGSMVPLGKRLFAIKGSYTARSKMTSTLTLTDEAVVRLCSLGDNERHLDGALRGICSPGVVRGSPTACRSRLNRLDDDEVVEQSGVKVVVDPFSLQYLSGAQIDFVDSLMGGGFTVVNPNAVKSCSCGQSFDTTFGGGAAKPCH